jgi:hypothetical protein
MHALIVDVALDRSRLAELQAELVDRVVPIVGAQPGFVAGYWLEPEDTGGAQLTGRSWILFDTEANAKAGAEMARNAPTPPGLTFTSVATLGVAAHA